MSDTAVIKDIEIKVASGTVKDNIFDSDTDASIASVTTLKKSLSDQREAEEDISEQGSTRFLPETIRWLDHKISDKIHLLVIPIYFE